MRSCRTRKRAFHFYKPGVVRRSHAAARLERARGPVAHAATLLHRRRCYLLLPPLLLMLLCIGSSMIEN